MAPGAAAVIRRRGLTLLSIVTLSTTAWATAMLVALPAAATTLPDSAPSGAILREGTGLRSPNGSHRLVVQGDGNVVLYSGSTAKWQSRTNGRPDVILAVQGDGNLVVYSAGHALWSSRTNGVGPVVLTVNDTGYLTLTHVGRLVWRAPRPPSAIAAGQALVPGMPLLSRNGRYSFVVQGDGNAVIYDGTRARWQTRTAGSTASRMAIQTDGNLVLSSNGRPVWSSGTHTVTGSVSLSLSDTGVLRIGSVTGVLWDTAVGNRCRANTAARAIRVSLDRQWAWFCEGSAQVMTSAVTTGRDTDPTPVGTWGILAKVTNTVLYPAGGGAYPVTYWMPYQGAYGLHDSPWQTFPYGSSLYHSTGSHGCIHLPGGIMAWYFRWAPVGSRVSVAA